MLKVKFKRGTNSVTRVQLTHKLVKKHSSKTLMLNQWQKQSKVRVLEWCRKQVQRVMQRVHKKSLKLTLEVLSKVVLTEAKKLWKKLTLNSTLKLTVKQAQMTHYKRQHFISKLWLMSYRTVSREKVPKKVRKKLTTLLQKSLSRWLMKKKFMLTKKPQTVAKFRLFMQSFNRTWWSNKEHKRKLQTKTELSKCYTLRVTLLKTKMNHKQKIRQVVMNFNL